MKTVLRSLLILAAAFSVTGAATAQNDCNIGLRTTILLANVPNRIVVQPQFLFGTLSGLIEKDLTGRPLWTATPLGPDGSLRIDSDALSAKELETLFSSSLPYARIARDPYIYPHGRKRCVPGEFQNHVDPHWWLEKIHAPEAWSRGQGNRSIIAAIVDSGIMSENADLNGNVFVTGAGFTVEVHGKPVTCSTGEHGYDAISEDCGSGPLSDHGTEVAGIVGAVANNGGVVGVNWVVTMLPVTVLDRGDGGCASRAVNALEFVRKFNERDRNVRVVNLSWGMDAPSDDLEKELRRLSDAGIVIVASAGNAGHDNDRFPVYPASYTSIPNLIAVTSTSRHRFMLANSNYGRASVHIAAPGQGIQTTGAILQDFPSFSNTSAAAPFVTGAIALLASQCPDMTGEELRNLVLNHSDTLIRLRFRRHVNLGRYLNLEKASKACEVWKRNRNTHP